MTEFELIALIRARTPKGAGVVLGIGDDAAVLQPTPGMQLVAATDNLVAGRHFVDSGDNRATPEEIGHLALAVNLSDLAAMGATPRWCLLTLTLPEADEQWLGAFLDGFLALAAEHECALIGGNIARGPLDIAVTVLGEVAAGRFATRRGARPGDRIVVTGTLGDAAGALVARSPAGSALRRRLLKPAPRIAAGRELAAAAHALIDISDGLLADLAHLLDDSLGARIELARLPTSSALAEAVPDPDERAELQLSGGSDYELMAAVGPDEALPEIAAVALAEIGRVTDAGRVECIDRDGRAFTPSRTGWDHFD
ncbi:MAG: thiamine-phosphate kinase [Wenzhouxiangellaceae bacterium]|nr:thiamine-phosphate kinase [Wenzhouxiangellaceae bacterium]